MFESNKSDRQHMNPSREKISSLLSRKKLNRNDNQNLKYKISRNQEQNKQNILNYEYKNVRQQFQQLQHFSNLKSKHRNMINQIIWQNTFLKKQLEYVKKINCDINEKLNIKQNQYSQLDSQYKHLLLKYNHKLEINNSKIKHLFQEDTKYNIKGLDKSQNQKEDYIKISVNNMNKSLEIQDEYQTVKQYSHRSRSKNTLQKFRQDLEKLDFKQAERIAKRGKSVIKF